MPHGLFRVDRRLDRIGWGSLTRSKTTVVPVKQRRAAKRRGMKGDAVTWTSTEYRSPLLLVRRRPPLESSETPLITLFRVRYRSFHSG